LYNNNTKTKFMVLRSKGLSLDEIKKRMKISKPTLIKWERDLKEDILKYHRDKTYEVMGLFIQDTLQFTKEIFQERNKAMAYFKKVNYNKLSKGELINIILKFDHILNKKLEFIKLLDSKFKDDRNNPYLSDDDAKIKKIKVIVTEIGSKDRERIMGISTDSSNEK